MPKSTKENEIEEKLKYIGLDLEKIPTFFTKNQALKYHPVKTVEENHYKVYRYIPVSKIQILLTPMNRLDSLKEKYAKSMPLDHYLRPETEEDILRHTTFLKMLKSVSIDKIEKMEEEQKKINKQIPFEVKYHENYLWQIYYVEETNSYFMLVPTEDQDYTTIFYLLKKQIEYSNTKKDTMIFVPITQEEYSGEYLKLSETADLEKYLWGLTSDWPSIYEVTDKKNKKTIQIIGNTKVYRQIKSMYKVELTSKEEAQRFFQLLKALFILQTTLPHHYTFQTKINKSAELEFYYHEKKIHYFSLMELLNNQYEKAKIEIEQIQKRKSELNKQLDELKQESFQKDQEYYLKEREIATYLKYKKTFLGKVKYYFRSKKRKKQKIEKTILQNLEQKHRIEEMSEKQTFLQKEYYTIEDIIDIYEILDHELSQVTNSQLDIKALQNKLNNMSRKIDNATLYIEEIDKHEKSIFEFWKFTNKDENLMLQEGNEEKQEKKRNIEKAFDYENDLEDIFVELDKHQRIMQTKQDTEDCFVMTTKIIEEMNDLEDEIELKESLQYWKEAYKKARIYEEIDLFGNVSEVKIQMLKGKKHREIKKDLFRILEISQHTTLQEYKGKLAQIKERIKKLLEKSFSPISISVYQVSEDELKENLQVFELLPEKELIKSKGEKEIYLNQIDLKEQKSKVIYFTNSIFYYNDNKTLPFGMDIETKCLVDIQQFVTKKKTEFYISYLTDEFHITTTKVIVCELEEIKEEPYD